VGLGRPKYSGRPEPAKHKEFPGKHEKRDLPHKLFAGGGKKERKRKKEKHPEGPKSSRFLKSEKGLKGVPG